MATGYTENGVISVGEVSSTKVNVKHLSRANDHPGNFYIHQELYHGFCLVGKTLRQKLYQLVIAV